MLSHVYRLILYYDMLCSNVVSCLILYYLLIPCFVVSFLALYCLIHMSIQLPIFLALFLCSFPALCLQHVHISQREIVLGFRAFAKPRRIDPFLNPKGT